MPTQTHPAIADTIKRYREWAESALEEAKGYEAKIAELEKLSDYGDDVYEVGTLLVIEKKHNSGVTEPTYTYTALKVRTNPRYYPEQTHWRLSGKKHEGIKYTWPTLLQAIQDGAAEPPKMWRVTNYEGVNVLN